MASLFDFPLEHGMENLPSFYRASLPFAYFQEMQRWSDDGKYFFLSRLVQKLLESYLEDDRHVDDKETLCKSVINENANPTKSAADLVELFTVDAKDFNPEEIVVKIKDRKLTVTGKHEEGTPDMANYAHTQFQQEFQLPKELDPNAVVCEMNSEGYLSFKAPTVISAVETNDHEAHIHQKDLPKGHNSDANLEHISAEKVDSVSLAN